MDALNQISGLYGLVENVATSHDQPYAKCRLPWRCRPNWHCRRDLLLRPVGLVDPAGRVDGRVGNVSSVWRYLRQGARKTYGGRAPAWRCYSMTTTTTS